MKKRIISFFIILLLILQFLEPYTYLKAKPTLFARITFQNAYLLYNHSTGWTSSWDESMVFGSYGSTVSSITDLTPYDHPVTNDELIELGLDNVAYCLDIYSKNPGYTGAEYDGESGLEKLIEIYGSGSFDRIQELLELGYPANKGYWYEHGVADEFVMMTATQIALWGITTAEGDPHRERLLSTLSEDGTYFLFNENLYPNSPGAQAMLCELIKVALGLPYDVSEITPGITVEAEDKPVYDPDTKLYEYRFEVTSSNCYEGYSVSIDGAGDGDSVKIGDEYYDAVLPEIKLDVSEGNIAIVVCSRDYDKKISLSAKPYYVDTSEYMFYDIEDSYEGSPVQKMLSMDIKGSLKLGEGTVAEVSGEGTIRKGSLKIYKKGEFLTDYKEDFVYEEGFLSGVEYGFYTDFGCSEGSLLRRAVTERGVALIEDVEEGTYYLKEIRTVDGYIKSDEVYEVVIGPKDNEPVFEPVIMSLVNQRTALSLDLIKTSEDMPVEGAVYGLYAGSDIYSCEDVLLVHEGELVETGVTDANGHIEYKKALPWGVDYYVKEIKAPYGYALDDKTYDVLSANVSDTLRVTDIKQKGSIEVLKYGEVLDSYDESEGFVYKEHFLDGVEFSLYSDSECEMLIKRGVTKDGKLSFSDLDIGDYYLKETASIDGYESSDEVYHVSIIPKKSEEVIKPVIVSVYNKRRKFSCVLDKKDIRTGKALSGAGYAVYAGSDIVNYKGVVIAKKGQKLAVASSDTKGRVTWDLDIPYGFDFYVKEVKAPAGYLISDDVFRFDSKLEDMSVLTAYDESTKILISKVIDIEPEKCLVGAKLALYDSEMNLIEEFESGEEPHVIYALPAGIYYLEELASPFGYEISERMKLEVKEVKEEQLYVMEDKAVLGSLSAKTAGDMDFDIEVTDTPKTGDEGYMKWLMCLLIAGVAGVMACMKKRLAMPVLFVLLSLMCIWSRQETTYADEYITVESDENDFSKVGKSKGVTYELERVEEIKNVETGRTAKSNMARDVLKVADIEKLKEPREVSVFDSYYREQVTISTPPSDIRVRKTYWIEDVIFDMTFDIKGDYIKYKDHVFAYDQDSPNVDAYVDEILDDLGVDKTKVKVDEIIWVSDAEENGDGYVRKASAKGQREVVDAVVEYFVDVPLKDIERITYRAVYKRVDSSDATQKEEITVKYDKKEDVKESVSVASEEGDENTSPAMVYIIGILVIVALIIVIVLTITMRKIRKKM